MPPYLSNTSRPSSWPCANGKVSPPGRFTAARMGEVLGTTWDEVDLVQPVPSRRMKAGIADRVPLSGASLAVSVQAAEIRMDDFGREVEA
jgi:hypothetical protein